MKKFAPRRSRRGANSHFASRCNTKASCFCKHLLLWGKSSLALFLRSTLRASRSLSLSGLERSTWEQKGPREAPSLLLSRDEQKEGVEPLFNCQRGLAVAPASSVSLPFSLGIEKWSQVSTPEKWRARRPGALVAPWRGVAPPRLRSCC